ncbi:hypothetical protein D9613_005968 [Agrocybe pediades]|uniref:Peptidase A1 domain-containing protein n=1 Tax=Agrocybe pediades TaxID=84607 RepID=A0A8H4QUV4_9AGAR|nr:hypothetical protein D9613_005968 [Agrocybe pediades]
MLGTTFVSFVLYTSFLFGLSQALHIQVRGRSSLSSNRVFRRESTSREIGGLTLDNTADVSYYAEILLGNQTFQVLIDTGSSDLWVAGEVSPSTDTGFNASIQYAANAVGGPVKEARLNLGGHIVEDQAFLQIPPDEANEEGTGILGLGPGSGSFIATQFGKIGGVTVLERIFQQNISAPPFMTILLGRTKDPTDFFTGSITVAEVLEEYHDILNVAKLNVTKVPDTLLDEQHHQILLDPDGIVGPDGKTIPFVTDVEGTENKKQATVVLDSGFTLPQVPRTVSDAIYSRFYGSEFVQIKGLGGVWIVPCEQEVNVTFSFAGKEYPIHPLDMTMHPSNVNLSDISTANGEMGCLGTFQPFTYDKGRTPSYDMVFGMAFMRNVYSLFNYGGYSGNTDEEGIGPYVQLLSITDRAEAHSDFVTARLGGIDTTGSRGLKKANNSGSGRTPMFLYIVAVVVVIAVLIAGAVLFVLRRRRRRRRLG